MFELQSVCKVIPAPLQVFLMAQSGEVQPAQPTELNFSEHQEHIRELGTEPLSNGARDVGPAEERSRRQRNAPAYENVVSSNLQKLQEIVADVVVEITRCYQEIVPVEGRPHPNACTAELMIFLQLPDGPMHLLGTPLFHSKAPGKHWRKACLLILKSAFV